MQVRWEERALDDLEAIASYIMHDNPRAAFKLTERLRNASLLLKDNPALGRTGRVVHSRELAVAGTAYSLVYRISDHTIIILRVLHGAREWAGESPK